VRISGLHRNTSSGSYGCLFSCTWAGTGAVVPAIDFVEYLIPMKYVPGTLTVNDAFAEPFPVR